MRVSRMDSGDPIVELIGAVERVLIGEANEGASLAERLSILVRSAELFQGRLEASEGRLAKVSGRLEEMLGVVTSLTALEYDRKVTLSEDDDWIVNALAIGLNIMGDELAQATRELTDARDGALAASRAKSAFLANMSHELRTPLNAIIGYAELIEEEFEGAQDATHLKDLRRIGTSAFHLLALINDVLDVSKIEAGKMDVFIETFDANALIEDVAETVETLAARNQNQLVVEFLGEHRTVAGDRTKVRQILYNLLSNACKFTDHGTITLRAEVAADDEGVEWLEIEVVDSGIGIPADRLEELFQPFRQADESTTRKYGGTGLGLAITRSFCELMGGTVLASSVVGQGSTFAVRIPRRVGSAELVPDSSDTGETSS